ncbi:TonB-dependent receptor domain-containing protein, partial [Pedobacter sp.]|uniref:TonB-dependent receptor domain-containing protein n=1 Tax=Pedobacter sp. TaxID=1411316 RepID=UPI003D7F1E1A
MGNIQRHKGKNSDGSINFSLNTRSANDKLQVSLSGKYMASKNTMVPYDFSSIGTTPPNAPTAFNADGSLDWESIGTDINGSKSVANINRLYENKTDNLTSNLTFVYKPINKVILKTIFGYNSLSGTEHVGTPSTVFNPAEANIASKRVGAFSEYNNRSLTISPYGEYRTNIAKKCDLSFKLGGEINRQLKHSSSITGTGFATDGLILNPATGNSITQSYTLNEYRSIGMYGLINFVWDNKYVIDINTRRDGSIKFGPGRRFGNFGSAAVAWIFSEENLFKDNLPWFSFGKLRASSGVVGGDAIKDFLYLSVYETVTGQYGGASALSPGNLTNPYLNWERNRNSEIALELGFLNNRINTNVSYYQNEARNQLVDMALPFTTGFSGQVVNSDAKIRNTGTEIEMNSVNIKSKNFSWSSRFNISFQKSKILKLPTQRLSFSNYVLNQSVSGVRVYKYNGVNPETGYYNFTKANGETGDFTYELNNDDKTAFIDLTPKYFGGFQNTFSYKQLSLDFTFSFTKRKAQSELGQTLFAVGFYGVNGSTLWLDRWQQPGDVTNVPKLSTDFGNIGRQSLFRESTGAYEDATYARLQNVSLRYSLSREISQKLHIKNLSVYLQGQ